MPVFKDPQQQSEIYQEMDRLSSKYGIQGELLDVEALARVLGKGVRDIWNMKARNAMPPIPVQRVGGRDHFRLVHVAMFTLGLMNTEVGASEEVRSLAEEAKRSKSTTASKPVEKPKRKSRKTGVMDDYIERKTLELLQARNPKVWGTGAANSKGDQPT